MTTINFDCAIHLSKLMTNLTKIKTMTMTMTMQRLDLSIEIIIWHIIFVLTLKPLTLIHTHTRVRMPWQCQMTHWVEPLCSIIINYYYCYHSYHYYYSFFMSDTPSQGLLQACTCIWRELGFGMQSTVKPLKCKLLSISTFHWSSCSFFIRI